MSVKISGTIIAFNEERSIGRAIRSMHHVCDEIVVVDSNSTDSTVEIAKDLGARVVQQKFLGHIEQKNFAMDQARYKVVLSLDADEELSGLLIESILTVKEDFTSEAYQFNRLNNYCGQWIRYGNWYPDRKVRLWKKDQGRWGGENPHDKVIMVDGAKISWLNGDLHHYTALTKEEHRLQVEKFSAIQAENLRSKGFRPNLFHLLGKPSFRFFQSYILKLGFLDGKAGWEVAKLQARLVYLRYRLI